MMDSVTIQRIHFKRDTDTLWVAYALNLREHYWNVLSNNPSKGLPYHNNQHSFTVALNAYQGGLIAGKNLRECQMLFLAGLYHDWNHTGTADEGRNIVQALVGWLEAVEAHGSPLSSKDVIAVTQLIEATDTTKTDHEYTEMEGILCDADALQSLEEDSEFFFKGLSEELGFPVTEETTKEFYQHHPLHTTWAKMRLMDSRFA